MASLYGGAARRMYVSRGVAPPDSAMVNRPWSATAERAASRILRAAASASASGSGSTTISGTAGSMSRSYPGLNAPPAIRAVRAGRRPDGADAPGPGAGGHGAPGRAQVSDLTGPPQRSDHADARVPPGRGPRPHARSLPPRVTSSPDARWHRQSFES